MTLWEWFFDVSGSVNRVSDGQALRIPPSEFLAWAEMTGRIVLTAEYAILRDMDAAFCAALNVEIGEAQARQRDKPKPPPKSRKKDGENG